MPAEGAWLVRLVFQRGLALIYLLAFLVAVRQFRPLAGENGLLPLERYVANRSFRERPSLLYLYPSDRLAGALAWVGVVLSAVALFAGPYWLPEPWPVPTSMLLWAVLWGLYQNFVNAGQLFYGYGWESMLLETGLLAIFLGAGVSAPPVVILWLLKWLLFRNMFGAGLIKIRGDDCWRDLTCLDDHYETQPIPNPLSWFAHHLPDRFHRLEVLGNHVVELAIPFLYFAPQPFAALGGFATIGFQGWLMLTGNFAWLNALTIVQATATLSDGMIASVLPIAAPLTAPTPVPLTLLSLLVGIIVALLSIRPLANLLSSRQVMNTSFDPLHLVNTYGAFGSITRSRHQLVIEGTMAADPAAEDWDAYAFYGQPVATGERPPQIAPYHLRLDWQLWFAAMQPRPGPRQEWLVTFLERLLEADAETLALVREDPFEGERPELVRISRYEYRYTTPSQRRQTGEWWRRKRCSTYVEPVALEDLRSRSTPGGRATFRRYTNT